MRLFRIASYGDDFYTGKIASGESVLMGLLCPNLMVIRFDSVGRYLSYEEIDLTLTPHQPDITNHYPEPGFQKQPIEIQEFFLDNQCLGIQLLPEHLLEFLEDPSTAENEEEAEEYRKMITCWQTDGNFVLWWGKDYWFDANGHVEST
jgi:hypothetical protein